MKPKELSHLVARQCPEILELVCRERPYRIPKQFMSWDVLSLHIAAGIGIFKFNPRGVDRATALHSARVALWFVQNAPIYCLRTGLLRAFQQSDVLESSHLFSDLEFPLPTFVLMFPQNSLHAPDGGIIDFCVVHLADVDRPELSSGAAYGIKVPSLSHEFKRNLHWSAIDSNGTVWFAGAGLTQDGRVQTTDNTIGRDALSREEQEFLRGVRSIILQCLLTLQYVPDLLSEPEPLTKQRSGERGQRRSDRPRLMQPRLLGANYQPTHTGSSAKGTHASPLTHWRRGHWRRVAVGEGRRERSWTWIKPTIVNASLTGH